MDIKEYLIAHGEKALGSSIPPSRSEVYADSLDQMPLVELDEKVKLAGSERRGWIIDAVKCTVTDFAGKIVLRDR